MYKVTCSLMVKENVPPAAERITKSAEVFEACKDMQALLQESVQVLLLNTKNKIYGREMVSLGGMADAALDPKILFRIVLLKGARSFIVVHNHPSGDPAPSSADDQITNRLKELAKMLEVGMLDHVIIGDGDKYYSYADEGAL